MDAPQATTAPSPSWGKIIDPRKHSRWELLRRVQGRGDVGGGIDPTAWARRSYTMSYAPVFQDTRTPGEHSRDAATLRKKEPAPLVAERGQGATRMVCIRGHGHQVARPGRAYLCVSMVARSPATTSVDPEPVLVRLPCALACWNGAQSLCVALCMSSQGLNLTSCCRCCSGGRKCTLYALESSPPTATTATFTTSIVK